MHASAAFSRPGLNIADALRAGAPLLFGIRLWASVCLALFVAFSLDLDNPYWAGSSAIIVCQPQLGAALRKGWFRVIGTVTGATMIVVLTACFPQDRIAFLLFLAVWCGLCAFVATVLRNFASYAAALAGYTAAIIAADVLGVSGGASPEVFMIAITRASEICIGIACASVILAATDFGDAQRRLADLFAALVTEIASGFTQMLATPISSLTETQLQRRELIRRAIALDPVIDQAVGESSRLLYSAGGLQAAVSGLFRALDGWRGVAVHLRRIADDADRQIRAVLRIIPPELGSGSGADPATHLMRDPLALRRACERAARALDAMPAATPWSRLLADETAKVLDGIARAIDGVALVVDVPGRAASEDPEFWPSVPDWMPALVGAARALVTVGAVELFWIASAWPSGGLTIMAAAAVTLLLSPRGDVAVVGTLAVVLGMIAAVVCAAIMKFAVLPALESFPAFCVAIGLFLVPVGFILAKSRQPAILGVVTVLGVNFMTLLGPTNQMRYDTTQFYNTALAIVVASGVAAVAFRLLPPVPPQIRSRRLLALTLHELRRLAIAPQPASAQDWERRIYERFVVLPDQAEPSQRSRLLAALSLGSEILRLRQSASQAGPNVELDAALAAFAQRNSTIAIDRLQRLDGSLASDLSAPDAATRSRARILVICEALSEHAVFFDGEVSA